mgnify:CR=1 FL=1
MTEDTTLNVSAASGLLANATDVDGGTLTSYSGNYEFYAQQRALSEKQQQALRHVGGAIENRTQDG